MSNQNIEELLLTCQEASQKRFEEGARDWYPREGTGILSIRDVTFGNFVSKKDGKSYGRLKVVGEVVAGTGAGNPWTLTLFGNLSIHTQTAANLASVLMNEKCPNNYAEIVRNVVRLGPGKTVEFSLAEKYVDGKEEPYRNIKFLGLIEVR